MHLYAHANTHIHIIQHKKNKTDKYINIKFLGVTVTGGGKEVESNRLLAQFHLSVIPSPAPLASSEGQGKLYNPKMSSVS